MMDSFRRFLDLEQVRAAIEGLGGGALMQIGWMSVIFHAYLGVMSFVTVTTGAILGVHAVIRLVFPKKKQEIEE